MYYWNFYIYTLKIKWNKILIKKKKRKKKNKK